MPKFYHIHRSSKPSNLEKRLKTNQPLFFSKKNSHWYLIEQDIGKRDYGGYVSYEITIPKNLFTTSFNPRNKNKIVKITKHNIDQYKQLKKLYRGHYNFIKEMNKRHIIGIDATSKFTDEHGGFLFTSLEGYIWKFPKTIKIKRYEVIKI